MSQPIDLLFLDGDQSPEGARIAYESFAPSVKKGGIIAVHNSADRDYDEGHDGYYRLVAESIQEPAFGNIYKVESTTFASKLEASVVLVSR